MFALVHYIVCLSVAYLLYMIGALSVKSFHCVALQTLGRAVVSRGFMLEETRALLTTVLSVYVFRNKLFLSCPSLRLHCSTVDMFTIIKTFDCVITKECPNNHERTSVVTIFQM